MINLPLHYLVNTSLCLVGERKKRKEKERVVKRGRIETLIETFKSNKEGNE